jgi:1-acyl-sn-glycerol-3-phosphate acyltransferase
MPPPRPKARPRERANLPRLREGASFVAVLLLFCGGSLAWSLVAAALHRLLPEEAGGRVGRAAMRAGFRVGLAAMRATGFATIDLGALDALAREGAMVVCCNHLSLLDAVLVVSRLPDTVCISKASLWDNPALGGSVRLAGFLRNDVPLRLVREGADALRNGRKLLVFPEGTRSDGGGLAPFRPGFVAMARAARVPIQTVVLRSNTPYLRRGWPLWRMPPLPLRYEAVPGRRFAADGPSHAVAAAIESWFAAELARR